MGAGFWVRYLTEHPEITVDKVILVAPWLNLDHKYSFDFFDFNIDQAITQRINEFVIFSSDNDDMGVQDTVKLLQQLPDAKVKDFHEYGHFTLRSMKTDAFPELLKAIV